MTVESSILQDKTNFRYTLWINNMSYHIFCSLSCWLILLSLFGTGARTACLAASQVRWLGALSTQPHPLVPSAACLLEPGKSPLCRWSLHLFLLSMLLWIYTFLSVNSFPCHLTGSWAQEERQTHEPKPKPTIKLSSKSSIELAPLKYFKFKNHEKSQPSY